MNVGMNMEKIKDLHRTTKFNMTDNEALKLAVKMHDEFNALSTKFDLEFELHKHMWFKYGSQRVTGICENTDDNKEDLFEGDGNTYSWDVRYVRYEDDDFLLAKVDNGCGDQYYALFLKEFEVNEHEDC